MEKTIEMYNRALSLKCIGNIEDIITMWDSGTRDREVFRRIVIVLAEDQYVHKMFLLDLIVRHFVIIKAITRFCI